MPLTKINKKIVITGTHHTPAIELICQLQQDNLINWDIYYISQLGLSDSHIKNFLLPLLNSHFFSIKSGKFDRYSFVNTITGIPKIFKSFQESINLLKKIKPDIVVSFGGFISVPVVIAAAVIKIVSITHEQTLTLSLSTKINSFFVKKIALSFNRNYGSFNYFFKNKYIVTGNLLRRHIFSKNSPNFNNLTKSLKKYPLIYITGGNQGSKAINNIVLPLLKQLTSTNIIIHQTGQEDYLQFSRLKLPNYYPYPYVNQDNIGWLFNNSSLIVSRSGANICQEISVFRKKAILIPLPVSQQNEQLLNALWLQRIQPSISAIINQSNLTSTLLLENITKLLRTKDLSQVIVPSINLKLLSLIHENI